MNFEFRGVIVEIPWWDEYLPRFFPTTTAYRSLEGSLLAISDIRVPTARKVHIGGFDPNRMQSVLAAFRDEIELPPIEVDRPPGAGAFVFRLRDGYHRFMASVAAGYTHIPVLFHPYFDFNDPAGIGWEALTGQ